MENVDQSVNDAPEASSPSSEESSSSTPEQASPQAEAAPKEVPFHEHPRFKELINYKNEASQRLQEYEKRFQELSSRIEQSNKPKEVSPEAKLLERLKGIDPEFGTWAEQQHQAKTQFEQQVKAINEWRAAQEAQSTRSQITSTLERLHTENKVPEPLREFYQAALQQAAQANPTLSLQDLPNLYKGIHDKFSKFLESSKRETVASYSQSKAKDSSVPAPAKGTSPKQGSPKVEYSKNPEEARAQIVERAMKSLRS